VRGVVPFIVALPVDLLEEGEAKEVAWEPADSVECEVCGLEMDPSEAHFNRTGEAFCEDCYSERYETCEGCGREIEADSAEYDPHTGDAYCERCYRERYVTCASCDEAVLREEARHSEQGEAYCEECYVRFFTSCDGCGVEVLLEEAFHLDDGTSYCDACFFLEHDLCSNCGEVLLKEEAPRTEGAFYCQSCYESLFAREGVGAAAEA